MSLAGARSSENIMKKKLCSTAYIQEANEQVNQLAAALPKILSQSLWQHRVPIAEKILFLKELGSARRALWQVVEKDYPEVVGQSYSISSSYVTVEVKSDLETEPSLQSEAGGIRAT